MGHPPALRRPGRATWRNASAGARHVGCSSSVRRTTNMIDRHRIARTFAAVAFISSVAGCGTESQGDFLGTYQTSLTLSGAGSQTFTDMVSVTEGTTTDLVITSQQIGALRATIIGDTSFSIDAQTITLTDANGQSITVNTSGQGTISDGVFAASGTLSTSAATLSFTMNGSRL